MDWKIKKTVTQVLHVRKEPDACPRPQMRTTPSVWHCSVTKMTDCWWSGKLSAN
jgi:hypothetical protein